MKTLVSCALLTCQTESVLQVRRLLFGALLALIVAGQGSIQLNSQQQEHATTAPPDLTRSNLVSSTDSCTPYNRARDAIDSTALIEQGPTLSDNCAPLSVIGNRIPIIFIHGIWGDEVGGTDQISTPNPTYFGNLLASMRQYDLSAFKIYRFHYTSDLPGMSVENIAADLGRHLDNLIARNPGFNQGFVIVAHSLGGLVARSYMEQYWHLQAPYHGRLGGEAVNLLITLGTPHHGTHLANKDTRIKGSHPFWTRVLNTVDTDVWADAHGCPDCATWPFTPNRGDALWDNFDYGSYRQREINDIVFIIILIMYLEP